MKSSDGDHIMVSVKEGPRVLLAVRSLPVRSLDVVPDDEFKAQYQDFLKRHENVTDKYSTRERGSMNAKHIIKIFFDPE